MRKEKLSEREEGDRQGRGMAQEEQQGVKLRVGRKGSEMRGGLQAERSGARREEDGVGGASRGLAVYRRCRLLAACEADSPRYYHTSTSYVFIFPAFLGSE